MPHPKPVVLCILDGWGLSPDTAANAPHLAHTPAFDAAWRDCPHATLITHGPDAGLPRGQMGNSEVGHTNIGAGRVVAMDLGQIDLAIEDGSFFTNPAILAFIDRLRAGLNRDAHQLLGADLVVAGDQQLPGPTAQHGPVHEAMSIHKAAGTTVEQQVKCRKLLGRLQGRGSRAGATRCATRGSGLR